MSNNIYTKKEIATIFSTVKTREDLEKVCNAFRWLLEKNEEKHSNFLHKTALLTFIKIN